jgi:altronate hydrolase
MTDTKRHTYIQIHPDDNVLVALEDLPSGTPIDFQGTSFNLIEYIPAKHKFTLTALEKDDDVFMYGVLVGKASKEIPKGGVLTVGNLVHAANGFALATRKTQWIKPDVTNFEERTFLGYPRGDGSVGTANYWLVIPLVFCENRNIQVLKESL